MSGKLPPGWQPLGLPLDWLAPIVMIAHGGGLPDADDALPVGPRGVRRSAATRRPRSSRASRSAGSRRRSTCSAGCSRRWPASCSSIVQGQGKADLATGYELDIIASAVVGGASLAGGRGSVVGAVLGALIFGVLRNALPQIPGATFYDRLIVGVVVIVIVVMDQVLLQEADRRAAASGRDGQLMDTRWSIASMTRAFVLLIAVAACGVRIGEPPAATRRAKPPLRFAVIPKALDIPVFNYAKIGAEREAAELGNVQILWNAPATRRSAEAEGDPRVVHHAEGGRHRHLGAERRLPDRDHRPGHRRRHSGVDLGLGRAQVEAARVLRRRRSRVRPDHGRAGD